MTTALKTRQTRTQTRIGVDLFERIDLSTANVDRANCIIRNVKILGKHSPNRHGLDVEGTDYLPPAHEQARSLYENMQVNVGHPPRKDPDAERDPDDRNGVLFNVKIQGGETFGDWKLIPSHPMTARFLDCASDPQLHNQFALSHNAKGYGTVRGGRYEITEIPKVRSVDVVCNGGTNASLFEGREPMKKKFKDILESALKTTKDRFKPLLHLFEDLGDMPVDPVAPPAEDMPAEAKPDGDYMSHLGELVKALVMNKDMTPDEITEKIMAAIKVMEETKEKPADVTEDDESEEDKKKAAEAQEAEECDDAAAKKDKMESREKEKQELAQLRGEKQVRNLCESLEFNPTALQIKALVPLSDADRKAFIKEQKSLKAPGKTTTQARTASGRTANVQESRTGGVPRETDYSDTSEEARKKRVADWKS